MKSTVYLFAGLLCRWPVLFAAMMLPLTVAQAGVPPEQIILSEKSATQRLGFHYKFWQIGEKYRIEFRFPEQIDEHYVPHDIVATMSDREGKIISKTVSWVHDSSIRFFTGDFNGDEFDLSIALGVCDDRVAMCGGARSYLLESVSEMMHKYGTKNREGELVGEW